ncbi:MAG: transposase [Candidatus Uhrbacteria bacterium]|nr:transposase [Candidatus Uhrbacteria bacterium]
MVSVNDSGNKRKRFPLRDKTNIVQSDEPYVQIHCYTLMPNHFHILLEQLVEDGISKFMGRLSNGYTKYFNKRNKRSGSLFESTFKAREICGTADLINISRYIHLNPLSVIRPKWKIQGIVNWHDTLNFLEQYPWSSYQSYMDINKQPFVESDRIMSCFSGAQDYKQFMQEWTPTDPRDFVQP